MYKLIMLPQPILVNCEKTLSINGDYYLGHPNYTTIHKWDMRGIHEGKQVWINKIIAGIEGLPKLDLFNVAKEIGHFDDDSLSMKFTVEGQKIYTAFAKDNNSSLALGGFLRGCTHGYKTAQSLNEKKYSEEDLKYAMFQAFKNGSRSPREGRESFNEVYNRTIQSLSKPKEYNVQYTQEGNTIKVTKIL